MAVKKPGIAKARVAQRRLHAVVSKPKPVQRERNKVARWLNRVVSLLLLKVRGRG
jgi:hypothetical protein